LIVCVYAAFLNEVITEVAVLLIGNGSAAEML